MLGDDRRQTAFDLCKSFVPRRFHKVAIPLYQRLAQAVRILMQVFKRHAFRTEITATEYVCGMSANALHAAFRHGDFKPAACLAKRADPMVDSFFSCFNHRLPSGKSAAPAEINSPAIVTLPTLLDVPA